MSALFLLLVVARVPFKGASPFQMTVWHNEKDSDFKGPVDTTITTATTAAAAAAAAAATTTTTTTTTTNHNNVHLSYAHQRPERSHHTY